MLRKILSALDDADKCDSDNGGWLFGALSEKPLLTLLFFFS